MLFVKFMMSQPEKQTITKHILSPISQGVKETGH